MTQAPACLYTYAQVERALAGVLGVRSDAGPAFEARLRHLRSLGVPGSERPGSGKRISYETGQAAQMLVALLFQSLGCAPRIAAQAAWTAAREFGAAKKGGDVFFLILPNEEFAIASLERLADLTRGQMVCAVLNLSRALAELNTLLTADDGTRAPSHARLSVKTRR